MTRLATAAKICDRFVGAEPSSAPRIPGAFGRSLAPPLHTVLRAVLALLLFQAMGIRAQAPPRLMPGERPPGRAWVTIAGEMPMRVYSGQVNAFRISPAAEFGAGLNFSPRHGLGFFSRVSPNELSGSITAPLGFAALVWQRHGRRENDSWGAGPAWRRWRPDSGRPGERGWTALYRKDCLDHPLTYSITTDFTCFPGQCSLGVAFGAGFYF